MKNVDINSFSDGSFESASHLSWVEGLHGVTLHEEHVYEVNEDARCSCGILRREDEPFVDYHEHQVAEQTQEEQKLGEKYQVQVVLFPEVPVIIEEMKAC